ncbi:MAG: alpha/beta-hydrolase family protein [Woeseiaceae bacterium]
MRVVSHLIRGLDRTGIVVALLFLAASLTPSLIPREAVLQGVLSGVSLALGYATGVAGHWIWNYLELPAPGRRAGQIVFALMAGVTVTIAVSSLWAWAFWQNSLRELMSMAPLDGIRWLFGTTAALAVFIVLLLLARLFQIVRRAMLSPLERFVPRRISAAAATVMAIWLFWLVAHGSVFSWFLRTADESYAALDRIAGVEIVRPSDGYETGSEESLVDWEKIGRTGRQYLAGGPTRGELLSFGLVNAREPIRVYVGLRSADTIEERAALALRELIRVGAFDRSVLVVAVPTGTGWLDPSAVDSLEYLHAGDVATVAMQYSYLASWMSLFFEPGYGIDSARALFHAVYQYWASLPVDDRPRLYQFGLSLGALSAERATSLYEVLEDPHDGAVLVGPPFASTTWRAVTNERVDGSPPWLPRFGDGSIVRFMAQENAPSDLVRGWGPLRVVYLQYASDPIVFFEPTMFFVKPGWMAPPRGPDVSPALRWYPVITALQVGIDTMLATEVPRGFGHNYAASNYLEAWIAVTEPEGWNSEALTALRQLLRRREAPQN